MAFIYPKFHLSEKGYLRSQELRISEGQNTTGICKSPNTWAQTSIEVYHIRIAKRTGTYCTMYVYYIYSLKQNIIIVIKKRTAQITHAQHKYIAHVIVGPR